MSWHQRLNAVQHLQDCKHDEENPFSQGFIEICLLPRKENIRLIYTLGKLNNWVLPISLMKETFPNTKFSRGSQSLFKMHCCGQCEAKRNEVSIHIDAFLLIFYVTGPQRNNPPTYQKRLLVLYQNQHLTVFSMHKKK